MDFLHKIGCYGTQSNNLLIWGENCKVLNLLKKNYKSKIQCIYADPPYNTCQTFDGFNDCLPQRKWAYMMKRRLRLLWSFLSDTGYMWISIDDNEYASLKVLCDSICGKDKYVATIVRQKNKFPSSLERPIVHMHDYLLVYAKSPDKIKFNWHFLDEAKEISSDNEERTAGWAPSNLLIRCSSLKVQSKLSDHIYGIKTPSWGEIVPPKGRCWKVNQYDYQRLLSEDKIWFDGNDPFPYEKIPLDKDSLTLPTTIWSSNFIDSNQEARLEIAKYNCNQFFYVPKPERMIKVVLELCTKPGDIVMDPFLGSGTTAVVAHKMNRQWIGIEKEEYQCNTICFERLKDTIDGNEYSSINENLSWTGGGGFSYYKVK